MNNIEHIFKRIPDKGLLIIGEAGEFWCDRARFSTHKPVVLPPVWRVEELQAGMEKALQKRYSGLFIAWGAGMLAQRREIFSRILAAVAEGGVIIAVEGWEQPAKEAEVNHRYFLEYLYSEPILPAARTMNLFKNTGITGVRKEEFSDWREYAGEADAAKLRERVEKILTQDGGGGAERLKAMIGETGLEMTPTVFYYGRKRAEAAGDKTGTLRSLGEGIKSAEALRKRILEVGLEGLSGEELLTAGLEIDIETSRNILVKYGGRALLKEKDFSQIPQMIGLEDQRSAAALAVLALGERLCSPVKNGVCSLKSPSEAAEYLADMRFLKKEQLRALYLAADGKVIWDEVVALGSLSRALISPRELLAPAIEHSAAALIIAHNHTTGPSEPSQDDVELTLKLESAAELMKIDLWDHIIIAGEGYYSFNEAGKIKAGEFFK